MTSHTSLTSAVLGVLGFLATVVALGIAYCAAHADGADATFFKLFIGWLLMSGWSVSPYIAAIVGTSFFAPRPMASIFFLIGTVLSVGYAVYLWVLVALKPSDGQNGMALMILPAIQWLILAVAAGAAACTHGKPAV